MASRKRKNEARHQKETGEKKTEKTGLLKKILDWVARGAERSQKNGTSCPT